MEHMTLQQVIDSLNKLKESQDRIERVIEYISEEFCNGNNLNECWHTEIGRILRILLGEEE